MSFSKYIIIILTFTGLMFTSCTEKVEVQLGETEPVVVIEGYVVTETDSSVIRISKTISYFSKDAPPPVTNATVEINDGSSTILFNHTSDGIYKPVAGFKADTGKTYKLKVVVDGKEFVSTSKLYPMFYVDSNLRFELKPAEGFLPEGYAVTYFSRDDRADLVYTKFNFGQNDTLFDQEVFFSNDQLIKYQYLPFELPFFRVQRGDSVMLIFRSLEKPVADYLVALSNLNSGAPGPFQTPPANPPTNISGGAIGYFLTSDVYRVGKVVP